MATLRVIAYIDGFNLYFGLKTSGWKRYYWLNIHRLACNLLKPHQVLIGVKYFTSRVSVPPGTPNRQKLYLEALETLPDVEIYFGKYQINERTCRNCNFVDQIPAEKMTDVNIAVELLSDAFQDRYDTALLISADSDLVGPVARVRSLFPHKGIVAAFPPNRFSHDLKIAADKQIFIGRDKIANSLLAEEIVKPDGYILRCPADWK